MKLYAVVMAGGWGERFWPLSRPSRPKQLLKLTGDTTLLDDALRRVTPLTAAENVWIAISSSPPELESAIAQHELGFRMVREPSKRNTTGAICWVVATLMSELEDADSAVVGLFPSDHLIAPIEQFRQAAQEAYGLAETEAAIVIMGISPTRPDTGFGYVEVDPSRRVGPTALEVSKFHEKPSLDVATSYIEQGGFLWNSGMLFFSVGTIKRELERHCPEVLERVVEMAAAMRLNDPFAAHAAFCELPDVSIDYLLLERCDRVLCVQAGFQWDDLGSWDSLPRVAALDESGNVRLGQVTLVDSDGCVVVNDARGVQVGVLGMSDVVVVVVDDAVLVCPKSHAQEVRNLVKRMSEDGTA